MAQDPHQLPERRTRRPSTTRLLKSAIAVGLTVRGIELDPVTGTLRVLVGDPGEGTPGGANLDHEPKG
jgi:hypothetical protein